MRALARSVNGIATLAVASVLLLSTRAAADDPDRAALRFEVSHPFTRQDARTRMQLMLDYWAERFGVKSRWEGDSAFVAGRVMGVPFHARLRLGDGMVDGQASDPGFFLRGAAYDYVSKKLRKYLHPRFEES
jgi:hypothetical protein